MNLRIPHAALLVVALLAGCQPAEEERFQGYVEGEPVMVAAQQNGQLTSLTVQRGDEVRAGTPLFSQDQATEAAGVSQAEAQLAQAQAQFRNLASGKRPPEIAVIEAQLKDAEARRTLSAEQLARQEALVAKGFVSAESLDQARTQLARDQAGVAQIRAQLESARLPGREAERASAQALVLASQAALEQSTIRLEQKSQLSPVAGRVQDVYYRTGEWAAPGQPVVSILPAENIKVRFFVPEPSLGALRVGQGVGIRCDGCPASVPATIRFISATAEYTPPVLFSEKNRHRLVFLVEAWPQPAGAAKLHPGQPVSVFLNSGQ
ncbi:MAG: HlyD family efflux transporter periplasmic adaptor subunit [Burkholderiales bacterium]|nr:MAG: HlyD family efflux transporter periplasmic adaptor subunit [Burkholderiales bacterium]